MTEPRIPLVPPEVSLKEFGYIPLEFRRLFQSDTWVLGTPEEKVAAIVGDCVTTADALARRARGRR